MGYGLGFAGQDGDATCDNFVDVDGDGVCDRAGLGQGMGYGRGGFRGPGFARHHGRWQ
jgi:hypothetical protein